MKDYSIANDIDGNSKEWNAFYWQRGWNSMATKITEKKCMPANETSRFYTIWSVLADMNGAS